MNYELLYNDLKERFDAVARKVEISEEAIAEGYCITEEYFMGQRVAYRKIAELLNDLDYEHRRKVWKQEDEE
jgi:hypothetical protein